LCIEFTLLEPKLTKIFVLYQRYVPTFLRGKLAQRTADMDATLDRFTNGIRRRLQLEGKVLTNFAEADGLPHFFRHITCNPGATFEDSDFLFAEIRRLGALLERESPTS
jgi:hypothetical protein